MKSDVDKVSDPLTPDQSRAQVMDAGREVVTTLDLHVVDGAFWHASCNDQGDPPFRGQLRIAYPAAPTFDDSKAQIAQMTDHLKASGWTGDPDFQSHGTVLQKNNVVAVFGPQNASDPNPEVMFYGECRDVTTTKETKGQPEPVSLP
ncbi:hypothetical protein [Mycolicibacterium komossense]|uniref:Lipoprotein LppJ n=1 Tax=Mycolicibacterium komossense TaxID=1779 RepID=A0ABT3CKD8_9MYCO|nr:hypothetical protein [Mycolicibacterium komossense]MCV7229963.1 hypothetical protein [Mycolicibacterium komossense]